MSDDAPTSHENREQGSAEAGAASDDNSPSDHTAQEDRSSRAPIAPDAAARLVTAALGGDLDAFEQLISRYQKAVFNIAYYKSKNVFDAEDLSQDIFLAAYTALPTLKDPENFGGWLIGIAHNRCHKWFRRERTKVLKFKELRDRKVRETRLQSRQGADHADDGRRISSEIRNLPHEISSVLVLKYLEGLSYEAIEARLGIKPYRIDYLIRKGKTLLRRRLRHEEQS